MLSRLQNSVLLILLEFIMRTSEILLRLEITKRKSQNFRKKSDFLLEYTSAKNVELESMQKSMQSSDAFNKKLSETLAKIAESEGYSMILSLQQANAILWYSNSVDITDQIIKKLGL